MAGRRSSAPLRVAKEGERPRPQTVAEAAEVGSERDQLVAMRAVAARRLDDPKTPGPAVAAIMRQMREIARDIAAIDARAADDRDGTVAPDEPFDAEAL